MNLLVDKREQEFSFEDAKEQSSLMESLNQDREPGAEFDKPKSPASKKSLLGPILTTILIFAAAFVVVYFGFYKKSVKWPLFPKNESAEQTSLEQKTQDEGSDVADNAQESTSQPGGEEFADSQYCVDIAPGIISVIHSVLSSTVKVNTIFFDEGSFSAELIASNETEAASVYRTMGAALGDKITLTSNEPRSGRSALIAGTFATAARGNATDISSIELEEKLRDMADEAGARVASVTISKSGQDQTVFLKLEGSIGNCQQFLQLLRQQNLAITVSKLLLFPAISGEYTFILRFYL